MKTLRRATGLGLVLLGLAASGCAGPAAAPALEPGRLLRMGSVQVDPAVRCVVATGFVNLVEGPIELMVCGPGGKRHESVFVLNGSPTDLQAALLLVGAKAGPPMSELGIGPPRGSRVAVWVQWRDEAGHLHSHPAEEFAYEWEPARALRNTDWIFTGSMFVDGRFKALAEESMVATYWDPWSILNLNHPVGADDEALSVNRRLVPPLHTDVTFLMVPR